MSGRFIGIDRIGEISKQQAAQPARLKFSELSHEDRAQLDQQRAVVAAAAMQRYGTSTPLPWVLVTDECGTDQRFALRARLFKSTRSL